MEKKIHQIEDPSKIKRLDILSFLLDTSAQAKLTPEEVIADSALIVVSATDTSVQAAVTIFRYLALDHERQSRLQAEVDSVLSSSVEDGSDTLASAISHLPFLDACLQESLRIVPPGPLRTTGSAGAHICGEYIPPNTTIHVPVYTMHRDPEYFGPLADNFIPERWLEDDPVRKTLASALPPIDPSSFMPFGAGFGSCIGKNLAIQNVKWVKRSPKLRIVLIRGIGIRNLAARVTARAFSYTENVIEDPQDCSTCNYFIECAQ
ncbi:cytochrome P450 [Mycena vulgaris]|nr:cytochrome P450 [Mycena vulgaris]